MYSFTAASTGMAAAWLWTAASAAVGEPSALTHIAPERPAASWPGRLIGAAASFVTHKASEVMLPPPGTSRLVPFVEFENTFPSMTVWGIPRAGSAWWRIVSIGATDVEFVVVMQTPVGRPQND